MSACLREGRSVGSLTGDSPVEDVIVFSGECEDLEELRPLNLRVCAAVAAKAI